MKVIALDFSGVDSVWELHERLKEAFHLPDYYGHNMDALWDCLHCMFAEPTTIVLRNVSAIPAELKKTTKTMLKLFAELEDRDQKVSVRIETGDNAYSGISDFML